jgi:hypothetical protein
MGPDLTVIRPPYFLSHTAEQTKSAQRRGASPLSGREERLTRSCPHLTAIWDRASDSRDFTVSESFTPLSTSPLLILDPIMSVLAPVAFEIEDFKSPARAVKTPVQKRLEQSSPKSSASPAQLEEKLLKSEQARQVCATRG